MATAKKSVLKWLLDADPSIRWQVLRDLTDEPEASVAAERSRVASEGWGAQLLDRQRPDGRWGDGSWRPTLPLLTPHADPVNLDMEGGRGKPSRWSTLRALRVLDWYAAQN